MKTPLTIRVPAIIGTFIHKNYCSDDDWRCDHDWQFEKGRSKNFKTCSKCGVTSHLSVIEKRSKKRGK